MECLVKEVCEGGRSQRYITFTSGRAMGQNELKSCYEQLLSRLDATQGKVVWEKAFGSLPCRGWVERCRAESLPEKYKKHPFTYLEGAPVEGFGLAGLTLYVIGGEEVGYLTRDGRTLGAEYCLDGGRRLYLSSSAGAQTGAVPGEFSGQFASAARQMQDALEQAGFGWRDVVRTWFYLGHIQRDYPRFNTLRRDLFDEAGVDYSADSNDLPASTCIEGAVPHADCAMELLCCDKRAVTLRRIYNPGQNEAEGKRSICTGQPFPEPCCCAPTAFASFSYRGRGVASTFRGGACIVPDPARQIAWSLQNIRNLLHAAGMDFSDIAQSTCFFKHSQDVRYFEPACEALGIAPSRISKCGATYAVKTCCLRSTASP